MILKTSDNFFDIETQRIIGDYCHRQYYNLFELDHPDMEPVGGTADVKGEMWDLFSNRIYSDFKDAIESFGFESSNSDNNFYIPDIIESRRLKKEILYRKWNSKKFSYPVNFCLLYTSPSPRDVEESRMPSSA